MRFVCGLSDDMDFRFLAKPNIFLSFSLYMQMTMSIWLSFCMTVSASDEDVTQTNCGGLLRFSSTYSLDIWDSICPSSSSMNAS